MWTFCYLLECFERRSYGTQSALPDGGGRKLRQNGIERSWPISSSFIQKKRMARQLGDRRYAETRGQIEQEKRVKWEEAAIEVDEMDEETRQNLREEVLELIPIEARALPKGTLEKMIYSRQVDFILERKSRQSGVA